MVDVLQVSGSDESSMLSKRDLFAAFAMQGLIAHYGVNRSNIFNAAYAAADAMIQLGSKEKNDD